MPLPGLLPAVAMLTDTGAHALNIAVDTGQ